MGLYILLVVWIHGAVIAVFSCATHPYTTEIGCLIRIVQRFPNAGCPDSIPRSSNPLCIALWSQVVSGSIWWMLQPGSISEPYTEDFPLTTDFLKGFLQFAMLLLQPVFLWSLFFIGTSTSFLSPKLRFSHVNHVEGRHFWKVMLHHISGKQKSCSKILQDGDFGQSPFFCEIH